MGREGVVCDLVMVSDLEHLAWCRRTLPHLQNDMTYGAVVFGAAGSVGGQQERSSVEGMNRLRRCREDGLEVLVPRLSRYVCIVMAFSLSVLSSARSPRLCALLRIVPYSAFRLRQYFAIVGDRVFLLL